MRKLKSIAVCALCLCLLLGLAGCAAAQRPLRVTLVLKTETDVAEFWGMLLSGVRKAAEEYGVDLTVRTSPTETAIDEQIELIRQTAAEKPDVMILSAADYDRCAEATEEAIAAGIGVVAVDTDVNAEGRACFVGSNNYQIGQEMGSQMASYLPEGGKVAVIQHMLTTTTGIDRTRGVIDALTQAGNIEILGSYCCDNSTLRAQEITTALLEDEPDIRGFVCTNEVCNVGAANALVELGMGGKVFVVGCDNSQRQIALLEQNIIQAIVIQRPFNMGYMAVQQAVRVAQGVDADVHNRARAAFLPVVNPADNGYDRVQQYAVVHAVLAVEGDGVAVMRGEQVHRVDYRVGVAEKAEHPVVGLLRRNGGEALGRHILVFLDQRLGDEELRLSVLPGI